MIEYKRIRFHSHMRNEHRDTIQKWLDGNTITDTDEEIPYKDIKWSYITSNYEYSDDGDFDVVFVNNGDAAMLFRMSFPKAEIISKEEVVTYEVDEKHFDNLFEAA